jgi:hypothetical protein
MTTVIQGDAWMVMDFDGNSFDHGTTGSTALSLFFVFCAVSSNQMLSWAIMPSPLRISYRQTGGSLEQKYSANERR